MNYKIIAALGILCISLAVFGGYYFYQFNQSQPETTKASPEEVQEEPGEDLLFLKLSPEQIQHADLEYRTASPGKLKMTVSLPGKIVANPDFYAHVVTKASGIVKEARKTAGDKIQKGEVLAVLESKELAETKAAYLSSLMQAQLAQATYERERRLNDRHINALSEYIEAEAKSITARIDVEVAKQRLYSLGLTDENISLLHNESANNFRILEIRAPFDGVVLSRHLTNGEVVDGSQETYVVADLSNVWVELGIYPKDMENVAEGQKIQIFDDLNKGEEATIIRLSPMLDSETSRVKAIALLNNQSGKWRPGTYVNGNLAKSELWVPILVPKDAVMNIDNENYLFVSQPEGFDKRSVVLGKDDGKNVEIVSGIRPGERYVVKNAFLLKFELTKGEPD